MHKNKLHEIKLESLRAQIILFKAVQGRHEIWAGGVDDPEIAKTHRRIIELIREAREESINLLSMYDQKA
jgi:hypothetical protein